MPHKTWQIYLWTTCEVSKIYCFFNFPFRGYCSSQSWPLFIVVPQAVNELPRQHWTKRAENVRWYCTRLKNRHVWNSRFSCEVYLCALTNKAQLIFLYNVVSGVFGQHWLDNILMQCCPRYNLSYNIPVVSIQHPIGYFPHKSCLLAMDQYCTGNFLMQCCEPDRSIFLCKVVCGLWANIAQVILLCDECWLRQI